MPGMDTDLAIPFNLGWDDLPDFFAGAGYILQTTVDLRGDTCQVWVNQTPDEFTPSHVTITGCRSRWTVAQYACDPQIHAYDSSCRCEPCRDEAELLAEDAALAKAGL